MLVILLIVPLIFTDELPTQQLLTSLVLSAPLPPPPPPDVLFRPVQDNQIDLLVLGTHGRTGLSELLLGSVAEKIFRHSPIPVLTVGPVFLGGRM
jgi:hypothetical protein